MKNAGNPGYVSTDNLSSFKYKSTILKELIAGSGNGVLKNARIVVPLKYLSNLWWSLKIPLIKCKVHLELNWTKNCVISDVAGNTVFKITNSKLYVLVVTLSIKDNIKLTKQLNKGFKRFVYWNQYKI